MTSLFSKRPKRVQTYYPGVTDEIKAKPVDVLGGTEASGIDIKLGVADKGFTVSGRVLAVETGAPIASAMLTYEPRPPETSNDPAQRPTFSGVPGGITTTNAKGEFRLDAVAPGKYNVHIESMGALTGISEFYADPVNFEIQSANIDKLEIKVHLGASISGVVVVENSDASAAIDAVTSLILMASSDTHSGPGLPGMSRVSADGAFRIGGLKPGKISIRSVAYGAQKFSVLRIERNGAEQLDGIDIQANEQITGVRVVVVQSNCVINGRVVIQGGTLSPESEISVWARPLNGTFIDTQRSVGVDSKGTFLIETLAPGDYEVEVSVNIQGPGGSRRPTAKQSVTVTSGTPAQTTLLLDLSAKRSDK
jgi:hypothetical protein